MELALKQRIIGAAVIIAVAVIVIPMLLDGSGSSSVRQIPTEPALHMPDSSSSMQQASIPLPPGEKSVAAPTEVAQSVKPMQSQAPATALEPTVPAAAVPIKEAVQKTVAPAAPTTSKPAATEHAVEKPKVTATRTPAPARVATVARKGWVVQVGSFVEYSKAMALQERLRKARFSAFIEKFEHGDKASMYRVKVGPERTRSDAEALLKQLRTREKLNGFVMENS